MRPNKKLELFPIEGAETALAGMFQIRNMRTDRPKFDAADWLRSRLVQASPCRLRRPGRSIARGARQFSADLVRVNADGGQQDSTGRLYVAGDSIRIETPDFPSNYFLIDLGARVSYFVQPVQRMIMDARALASASAWCSCRSIPTIRARNGRRRRRSPARQ